MQNARVSRSISARCGGTSACCKAAVAPAELWAVVKADAYGHGALDCARAALAEGASGLCVATVFEGLEVRDIREHEIRDVRGTAFASTRTLVMGPLGAGEWTFARAAKLEVVASSPDLPEKAARPPEGRHRHGPSRHDA